MSGANVDFPLSVPRQLWDRRKVNRVHAFKGTGGTRVSGKEIAAEAEGLEGESAYPIVFFIYEFLKAPQSSTPASIWSIVMLLCVTVRLLLLAVESIDAPDKYYGRAQDNSTYRFVPDGQTLWTIYLLCVSPQIIDSLLRTIVVCLVAIGGGTDVARRELSRDSYSQFLFFAEILSIVPYLVTIHYTTDSRLVSLASLKLDETSRVVLRFLEILSLARALRWHIEKPQVLFITKTIARIAHTLTLPLAAFTALNLILAVFYFYVEPCYDPLTCTFPDLFSAFYYSVVITTGLGYSQPQAQSFAGRVISASSMLGRWGLLGVCVAIVGHEYSFVVERHYEEALRAEQAAIVAKQQQQHQRRVLLDHRAFAATAEIAEISPMVVEANLLRREELVLLLRAAREGFLRILRAVRTPSFRLQQMPASEPNQEQEQDKDHGHQRESVRVSVSAAVLLELAPIRATLARALQLGMAQYETALKREARLPPLVPSAAPAPGAAHMHNEVAANPAAAATEAAVVAYGARPRQVSLSAWAVTAPAGSMGSAGLNSLDGGGLDDRPSREANVTPGGSPNPSTSPSPSPRAKARARAKRASVRRRHAKLSLFRRMFGMLQAVEDKITKDKDKQHMDRERNQSETQRQEQQTQQMQTSAGGVVAGRNANQVSAAASAAVLAAVTVGSASAVRALTPPSTRTGRDREIVGGNLETILEQVQTDTSTERVESNRGIAQEEDHDKDEYDNDSEDEDEDEDDDEEDDDEDGLSPEFTFLRPSDITWAVTQLWHTATSVLFAWLSAVLAPRSRNYRREAHKARLDRAAQQPHLLKHRIYLLLHAPHTSLQATAYRILHITVFVLAIALLMAETAPSVMQTGPTSGACQAVMSRYCGNKNVRALDPGCFTGATLSTSAAASTTKLRFWCSGVDCFGQPGNFGSGSIPTAVSGSYPCSALFQTQSQLDFAQGGGGLGPTLTIAKPSIAADERFALCSRIECTPRALRVSSPSSTGSIEASELASKSLVMGQWFELAEGLLFGLWMADSTMHLLAHESWLDYFADLGSYCDVLGILPFFAPFALRDENILSYAYGNGGSGPNDPKNLPWYFIIASLMPAGKAGLSVIQSFKVFRLVRVWRLTPATEKFSEVIIEAMPRMTVLWLCAALFSLLCGMLSYELEGTVGTFGSPNGNKLEGSNHGAFVSILEAWWYAINTLCAVGAGGASGQDIPIGSAAKALGVLWLFLGSCFVALPICAVASAYTSVAARFDAAALSLQSHQSQQSTALAIAHPRRQQQQQQQLSALEQALATDNFSPVFSDEPMLRLQMERFFDKLDEVQTRLTVWAEGLKGKASNSSNETPMTALVETADSFVRLLSDYEPAVRTLVQQNRRGERFENAVMRVGATKLELLGDSL